MKGISLLIFCVIQCMPTYSSRHYIGIITSIILIFIFVLLAVVQFLDNLVEDTLYFGQRSYFNTTIKDCIWRDLSKDRQLCSNEVTITLFSNGREERVSVCEVYNTSIK